MGRPRKDLTKGRPQRMFIATESFVCRLDGTDHSIVKGDTRVWEGHELVERYPQYFASIEAHYGLRWETTTAAPGEVRGDTD